MSLFSSPRRRRRLIVLTPVLGLVAVVAFAVWLLPSSNSEPSVTAPPTNPLAPAPRPSSPAADRASRAAAAAVAPLADTFVDSVLHRRNLARAHALLDPELREQYALADWERGHDLPFSVDDPDAASSSSVLSFYGPKSVGYVASIDPGNAAASGEATTLVAIRFVKTDRWLIDYLRRGHSSAFVSEATYAPHGFLPGSHEETFRTWSVLVLGFLGVVVLVALLDRWLARAPKDTAHEAL